MATILPPPPPGLPTTPTPQAGTLAQAVNPTDQLLAAFRTLPPGGLVEASVDALLARGAVRVETPLGPLTLQTAFVLPRAVATITLALNTLTPALTFHIAAVDGRPTAGPARTSAPPKTESRPVSQAGAAGVAASAKTPGAASLPPTLARLPGAIPGSVLGATVVSPAPPAVGAATGTRIARPSGSAPAAAKLPATPITQTLRTGVGRLSALFGAAQPKGVAAPGSGGPLSAGAPPFSPAPGAEIRIRLVSVSPPGGANPATDTTTPSSEPAGKAPGGTANPVAVAATVTGKTAAGLPVVRTPFGALAILTKTPMEPGSKIAFEWADAPSAARGPAPDVAAFWRREGLALDADAWRSLTEALALLKEASPKAHQAAVRTALPAADNRLAANFLFFLAALRGGDVRGWLGSGAVQMLQARAPDLMTRIGDDFTQLARAVDDPASADWRLAVVPFLDGAEVTPVRLFLRGRRRQGGEGDRDATRFVIDVDLSRIGKLQLDGLVRGGRKHVDLIVRAERPLPIAMRTDIQAIFQETGELTGMKGGIAFQAAPPGFIKFSESGASSPSGDGPTPATFI